MNAPQRPTFTDDQLVERYIQIRNFIEEEAAAQAKFLEPHIKGMAAIQGELHRRLLERNPEWRRGTKASGSTEHGTFFLKTTSSIKVADREAFWDFLVDVDEGTGPDIDPTYILLQVRERLARFLTAHVAKEAVEEYAEKNATKLPDGTSVEPLPPGVTREFITECQVRKS